MGAVYLLKCDDPKCNYKETEWELLYAHDYRRVHNTRKEVLDGLWGEQLQKLVMNNEGGLDISEYLYVCDACLYMEALPALIFSKRKEGSNFSWMHELDEITTEKFHEGVKRMYNLPNFYQHRCKKCNTVMRRVKDPVNEVILCPCCKRRLRGTCIGVS